MNAQREYRLALDINTSAIGLVTYLLNEDTQPYKLQHMDVRVFGEPLADAKTGKLKKTQRREKRLMRRQVQRRVQRMKKIAHLFSLAGTTSALVHKVQEKQAQGSVHKWRSDAVTEKISIEQLMAVFLLMAKNRGYEGRFTKAEDGKVSSAISELENLMEEYDCTTLGQLLYKRKCNMESTKEAWKKISETGTYARRDMLQDEFAKIWECQEKHHKEVLKNKDSDGKCIKEVYETYFDNEKVKSILQRNKDVSMRDLFYHALFDQRPIWWNKDSIGTCELEPKHYRASRAHPVFQEYRIEQLLNDLEIKFSKSITNTLEKEKIETFFGDKRTVSVKKLYEQTIKDSTTKQILESLQGFSKIFDTDNDSTDSNQKEQLTSCFLWRNKDLELKISGKRKLREEEKEKVRRLFHQHKEVSAKALYKELGITDGRFTHDRSASSGEKEHKFKGNATACELKKLEKDADMQLSERERELFIEIIADIDEPSFFGYENWNEREEVREYFDINSQSENKNVIAFINTLFEKEKIQTLKAMKLDTGRSDYSVKALKKLLPHMREGKRPDEARDIEYPNWKKTRYDNLSRVGDSVVQQALDETKKAIDYAIKKHKGQLPTQVVIELSREMKLSQEKRGKIEAIQRAKKRARDAAWKELEKTGVSPNESLCKKYILWQEQKLKCAYCGKYLEEANLCSEETEIDHIVPQGYGGQNNHANLVVVCRKCNQIKGKKLPMEAFAGEKNENAIKAMSDTMKNPSYLTNPFRAYCKDVVRRAKLLLEKNQENFEDGFRLRQNSETAWIGRELTTYLKKRLNIKITDKGTLEDRVYVTRGTLTSHLRRTCGLNTLIPDIRKEEGKPVFNRKGELMDDGGEHHCGSWHDIFSDIEKNYDKRIDHRHHAVDAAVIGLVDRSIFIKATKFYKDPKNYKVSKKTGKKYPTLSGFEKDITLQNQLRTILKPRLCNYVVWHKADRQPIDGFFDENIYRCKGATLKLKEGKNLPELAADTFEATKKNLEEYIEDTKNVQRIIKQFTNKYSEGKEKTEKAKCKNALLGVEKDINKLIKRKTLEELAGKTFDNTRKTLELIVGEDVKKHVITEFERRHHESTEVNEEKKCKNALCGASTDDGIFYPAETKNKVKCVRVYHKATNSVGTYNENYDKIISVRDSRKIRHNHVLNNDGYACFEIVEDEKENLTYKPIPYHTYWTKEYQAKLKTDDKIVRIYKNDIVCDRESKEYYVVKQLHSSSKNLKCIKTTETMTYADAKSKAKQVMKDFGKTKINYIQVIKSRGELVDSMNTHEPPSDCST